MTFHTPQSLADGEAKGESEETKPPRVRPWTGEDSREASLKSRVCVLSPLGEGLLTGRWPSPSLLWARDAQLLWDPDPRPGTTVELCGRPHIHVSQARVHRASS